MRMRSKQWYTKTSRLEYSFAKSSIGRRSSDRVLTTRSSVRRPVESKFQISLASFSRALWAAHAVLLPRSNLCALVWYVVGHPDDDAPSCARYSDSGRSLGP